MALPLKKTSITKKGIQLKEAKKREKAKERQKKRRSSKSVGARATRLEKRENYCS